MLFLSDLNNITPTRNFNLTYIILDSIFCVFLLALLVFKKKYVTLAWAIFGGVLYYLVDYGYFYLISRSREVLVNGVFTEANNALVLLWMSLSYGITNFIFIWVLLNNDKFKKEFLFLIIGWWLVCPSIARLGGDFNIQTFRTTNQYHGYMALILVVGYLIVILYNLFNKKDERISLFKLNLIGISVQFSWELALLINGIRPMNDASIMTLLIDSLIETNLGLPYMYFIHKWVYSHYDETFKKVEIKRNDEASLNA